METGNKWAELDTLNLNGFICYAKERRGKRGNLFTYYFTKKEGNKYLDIKVNDFESIELQLKYNLTR
jgi:hypothetical protein